MVWDVFCRAISLIRLARRLVLVDFPLSPPEREASNDGSDLAERPGYHFFRIPFPAVVWTRFDRKRESRSFEVLNR